MTDKTQNSPQVTEEIVELTQEEAAKLIKGLKATADGKYATA